MAVKILGGLAKGSKLAVPKGTLIRPSSVRLKRRLFDSRQNWTGQVVFDLCAGSGSLGLEAWSRGAERVYLVESSPRALPCLKKNAQNLSRRFPRRPIVVEFQNVVAYVDKLRHEYPAWPARQQKNTNLFFDPPYRDHQLHARLQRLFELKWFKGRLYVESDRQKGLRPDQLAPFGSPTKIFSRGSSYLALFQC